MGFEPGLKPGDKVTNDVLTDIFKCGPQGGMRRSHTNKLSGHCVRSHEGDL